MAKIIGNTTATPNPRPDWNQTDEAKADYIKNKPTGLATEDYVNDKLDLKADKTDIKNWSAEIVDNVFILQLKGE